VTTAHTNNQGASIPPFYKRRWFRITAELALILAVFLGIRQWQRRGIVTGMAPPLAGTTVAGQTVDLAEYRGAPVLVHFWGTWCPVCRAEQHNIVALAQDHPLLTVATYSGEASEVQEYLSKSPIGAPTLIDPKGDWARAYHVKSYPTTFVLDGQGEIKHVEVGYASELGLRFHMWWAGI